MVAESKMIPRILRDVSDGVLVLDRRGTVLFLNPQGEKLLGFGSDAVGKKYAALMLENSRKGNESFQQFLLDSLNETETTHKGEILYAQPDGTVIHLRMSTSFLFDEQGVEYEGVVIQFADISETVKLRQKQQESSFTFVTVIIYVCSWIFLYVVWELMGRPISDQLMTWVVQLLGLVVFYLVLKKTSFSLQDLGLGFKNAKSAIVADSIIAGVGFVLLVLIKIVIKLAAPDYFEPGKPFFNFDFGLGEWMYPVVVILQEFLTRSVMHENLRRIIVGKNSEWMAIFVSSILFGVLHIHKGIVFMLGAVILLGALGMLYRKQRTIWGLCIPHYVLGQALTILDLF